MSESSGLSFFQKVFGFTAPAAIEGAAIAPPSAKDNDNYGASTLQKSQKEQDEENSKNLSSLPWLPPILMQTDVTAYTLDLMQSKVIDFILKKWSESNKEVGEAARQKIMDEIRTGFNHLFGSQVIPGAISFSAASAPAKVAKEGFIPQVGKSEGTKASIGAAVRPDDLSSATAGILLMMVSAVAMMGVAGGAVGVGQPGLAVMSEMINGVVLPTGLIKPDMKVELHQLSALMLIPLFYPAMAKALGDVGSKGGSLHLSFATQQLNQAVLLVTDKNFGLFLKSVLSTQMPHVKPEHHNNLLYAAKLMILYAALATYYQAETGWTSGQEIGDMVNGKLFLQNPGDPRLAVVALIKQQFKEMGLSEEAAEKVNQKFASYLGDKNSVEDFVRPSKLFTDMSADLVPERIKNSTE